MRLRLCTLALLAVIVWIAPTPAQEAPSSQSGSPSFRTSADLVTIDAVVTDADGRHVTDLTPADFEVTVGGKRQDLQQSVYIKTAAQPRGLGAARTLNIAHPGEPAGPPPRRSAASLALKNTPLPPDRVYRTIALVVDDLGLSFRGTVDVRKALKRYIDTQMAPGDLVAIVRTAGGVGTLQQFTTDRRLLHLAADRVQWDFRSRQAVGFFKVSTPGTGVGDVDDGAAGEIR